MSSILGLNALNPGSLRTLVGEPRGGPPAPSLTHPDYTRLRTLFQFPSSKKLPRRASNWARSAYRYAGRPFEVGFECDPELYRKEHPQ